MEITGREADFLLYLLDQAFPVDQDGKLLPYTKNRVQHYVLCATQFSFDQIQDLRDRLFTAHEHPEED